MTTFLEALDGVDFEHRKTVRIRNRYDADVPVVIGPVARRHPVFVEAARFLARRDGAARSKVTLPGPMTMVDTLYDAHYKSREKLAWAFAEILNDEARAIEATGVDVIQFDEPAFNVYFDEVRDWGVATLERAAQGLVVRHGRPYLLRLRHQGQHRLEEDARRGVAAVRADLSPAGAIVHPAGLAGMREFARARSSSSGSSRARTCWSARSTWRPTGSRRPRTSPRTLRAALQHVPAERLYPCTNCGMVPLSREVARGKLRALAAGAALVRAEA